ncbi:CPK1 [Symbiodinium natans]|uniref:CPK1 protein n=1 Tax=Symbiodinium natans TaxID=878477 RepID=A0A812QZY3_9DINO|nr:CPK1 [Symbiodinium natans]
MAECLGALDELEETQLYPRESRENKLLRWEGISETAKHFVRSLLRKDPYERLSAAEAAQHAWLKMDQAAKASWPQGTPDAELELPINRCVVRDMWKFAQNNAITRAALGIFGKLQSSSAFGGREEDVTLLEQRFRSFDEHSSGKISAETFIKVLKESLQVQISSSEEKEFFDRIADVSLPADEETAAEDVSKHCDRWIREVNYKEFIMITKAQRRNITTAAIREVFRAFDENGDGYIKEDDAHSLLGQEFKDTISSYVTKLGKDVIDYRDFSKLVSMEIAKAEDHPHSEEAKADVPGAPALSGRIGCLITSCAWKLRFCKLTVILRQSHAFDAQERLIGLETCAI